VVAPLTGVLVNRLGALSSTLAEAINAAAWTAQETSRLSAAWNLIYCPAVTWTGSIQSWYEKLQEAAVAVQKGNMDYLLHSTPGLRKPAVGHRK